MHAKIVLTADNGTFSDYGGTSALGYVSCMPARLVPRILMKKVFAPPLATTRSGEAIKATYPLRKIEALLSGAGMKDVVITSPDRLEKVIGPETRVLGVSVHDPYGLSPVSTKLTMIFGGGMSWTARFFDDLSKKISVLKRKYSFTTFVGGPAAWQIEMKRPEWVDILFNGEAEVDLAPLVKDAVDGKPVPRSVFGKNAPLAAIPAIIKPTRFGEVQVTRGCPRGCQFCTITPETFRSIPVSQVVEEVKVNVDHGQTSINLLTDDILLYGGRKLSTNHEAIVNLFTEVKKAGAEQVYFPHISSPAVLESSRTVMAIGEIAEYDKYRGETPVVGLESGSERIISKYMNAKPYPWKPSDWKKVILDSTPILNDAGITPCYTMTVGFEDETNEDVEKSIDLVEAMIDSHFRSWIFPLAVIPMTPSHIGGGEFPNIERLPSKYWDLLYTAWKYDLYISRRMMPIMSTKMGNPVSRNIVNLMTDKIFAHIDGIFRKLSETHGMKAHDYSEINLDNLYGVLRSMFWIGKVSVSRSGTTRSRTA